VKIVIRGRGRSAHADRPGWDRDETACPLNRTIRRDETGTRLPAKMRVCDGPGRIRTCALRIMSGPGGAHPGVVLAQVSGAESGCRGSDPPSWGHGSGHGFPRPVPSTTGHKLCPPHEATAQLESALNLLFAGVRRATAPPNGVRPRRHQSNSSANRRREQPAPGPSQCAIPPSGSTRARRPRLTEEPTGLLRSGGLNGAIR
jgi:hypothetical protein